MQQIAAFDFDALYARYSRFPGYRAPNIVIWDIKTDSAQQGRYSCSFISHVRYIPELERYCVCAPGELLFLYPSASSHYYSHISADHYSFTKEFVSVNKYQPLHDHIGLVTYMKNDASRSSLLSSNMARYVETDRDTSLICELPDDDLTVSGDMERELSIRAINAARIIGYKTDSGWMYTVFPRTSGVDHIYHLYYNSVHILTERSTFSEFQAECVKRMRQDLVHDILTECPSPHPGIDCDDEYCRGECRWRQS